jgi:hypothetical protein
VILFNTAILTIDRYPEPDAEFYETLALLELVCSAAFIMEMACKLAGLGLFQYCSERWNLLDGFIVLTSVVELALAPPPFLSGGDEPWPPRESKAGPVSVLRVFRLARVMKMLRQFDTLQKTMDVLMKMLQSVVDFGVIVFLVQVNAVEWSSMKHNEA